MPATVGFHIVISGYGLWLPGDQRGSWSTAWDVQLGLIEPHALHPGDRVRLRMAEERTKHSPVLLSAEMHESVVASLADCTAKSEWSVAAASIESTHTHLLLTYTERHIDNTVKWIKDQTAKAVHRQTVHRGPVWCKGKWRSFLSDFEVWQTTRAYIEEHNVRRGVGRSPYPFITAEIPGYP